MTQSHTDTTASFPEPGNVEAALEWSRISQSVVTSFYYFPSLCCCCLPVKTPLFLVCVIWLTYKNRFFNPPHHHHHHHHPHESPCPHPVVIVKRWCIQQSMAVTLLCRYPSFLPGPLWFSEAPEAQHPGTVHRWGMGNLRDCARLFSACVWMSVCFYRACVCVQHVRNAEHGNYIQRACLHKRKRLVCDDVVCVGVVPHLHPPPKSYPTCTPPGIGVCAPKWLFWPSLLSPTICFI